MPDLVEAETRAACHAALRETIQLEGREGTWMLFNISCFDRDSLARSWPKLRDALEQHMTCLGRVVVIPHIEQLNLVQEAARACCLAKLCDVDLALDRGAGENEIMLAVNKDILLVFKAVGIDYVAAEQVAFLAGKITASGP
ncbi:hypothetical protein N2152v2_001425 [Parachlorella kessleri]